jgi:hypothetical protein
MKYLNRGRVALAIAVLWLPIAGAAHASTTIEFTPITPDPNDGGAANSAAYGSDANVSVGYSPYIYNYPDGYGALDGGTGAGIYSDNYLPNIATITFVAKPGYTVTLDSFELATYLGESESDAISVTGGQSAYSFTDSPSTTTFTTYSPNETGTSLTLSITNLYDVGLNTITYSETAVPEPASWLLMLGGFTMAGIGLRRRNPRVTPPLSAS